jgi:uncharacterized protein YjbI with pentapeptide repeats
VLYPCAAREVIVLILATAGEFLWTPFDTARAYWANPDFRFGVGTALFLVLVLWALRRLWRMWRAHLRRPRPEVLAREIGCPDERIDAHVLERVVSDPALSGPWHHAMQMVQAAEAQLDRAKEQKGLLLAQMARYDRELATLLAKRQAAGGPTLEVRTIRDLGTDHATALVQGAAAWAAYRSRLPHPPSLVGADLSGMDLSGFDLREVELYRAVLVGCKFDGADLSGADLIAATCVGSTFVSARLDGALLSRADFSHCDLRGASMVGVELSRAALVGAHTDGARMAGSRLDFTIMPDSSVSSGWVEE